MTEESTTNPYLSPMYNYGSSILTLTNPESEIYRLELTLRSMILDNEGNPKQIGQPLMNEQGITSVLQLTQTVLNQVTILSNFSKSEIPYLMGFINDTLVRDLMQNRIKYGIKDFSTRDKLFFMVMTYCFIALKRGYEEGDRRFWKGSQQEIRTELVNAQQPKKSFMQHLGWGKG